MQRISATTTFVSKRVFPVFWFGFIAVFIVIVLRNVGPGRGVPPLLLIVPVAMALFGYVVMKKLVFDLADEVSDDGDALVVRFGDEQERVALEEIINLSYSPLMNPPRATLTLRHPGKFGREISFYPLRKTFLPWSRNPLITDLIERIDSARQSRAR
jgi:hypothetical protein